MEEAICKRLCDVRENFKNKPKLTDDDLHV
jgi:hypothetical protein